jgi:CRISPR-associated Cas5-like protein
MAQDTALEVTITAPVVSFRNPLYAGVQVGLACPPPSTVGGLLAAAAGGWQAVDPDTQFAMAFHARGRGVDLETYHPLEASGRTAEPTPRDRDFLADVCLTVWLLEEIDLWERRLRCPVWPLRLGRSQDLVGVHLGRVALTSGPGRQGAAVVSAKDSSAGTWLRLPTAVALDRSRTRWDDYRYDASGRSEQAVGSGHARSDGQAVVLLPPTNPVHAGPG